MPPDSDGASDKKEEKFVAPPPEFFDEIARALDEGEKKEEIVTPVAEPIIEAVVEAVVEGSSAYVGTVDEKKEEIINFLQKDSDKEYPFINFRAFSKKVRVEPGGYDETRSVVYDIEKDVIVTCKLTLGFEVFQVYKSSLVSELKNSGPEKIWDDGFISGNDEKYSDFKVDEKDMGSYEKLINGEYAIVLKTIVDQQKQLLQGLIDARDSFGGGDTSPQYLLTNTHAEEVTKRINEYETLLSYIQYGG